MPLEKKFTQRRRKPRMSKVFTAKQKRAISQIIDKKDEKTIEKKYKLFEWDQDTISAVYTAANVHNITNIVEGTDFDERIGGEILVKSIFARLSFSAGDINNQIRVMIFVDRNAKNDGNNNPALSEVLETGTVVTTEALLMSVLNLSSDRGRFKILFDRHICLNTDNPQEIIELYKEVNIKKYYEYNTGAPSDGKNSIYIAFVSDSGAIPHPSVAGCLRVGYYDA